MVLTPIDNAESDVALVRELARKALFGIEYHEESLVTAARVKALARSLIERCECDFTIEQARDTYLDYSDDGEGYVDADHLFRCLIGSIVQDVDYHERHLAEAHQELAGVKALLLRGNFPPTVMDEARELVRKRREEREKK